MPRPAALKPVKLGEQFELPNGDLVRIESIIPGDDFPYYVARADHGWEVDDRWLNARGYRFDPKSKRRAERQRFIDRMNQAKTISEAGRVRRELEAFDKETREGGHLR